jgi:energy-coupling factor transport system permease protein
VPPPHFLRRPPAGPYRDLNPATKLVIASSTGALALTVHGWAVPGLLLVLVGLTAVVARAGRALVPFALATLPLVVSILAINTFFSPGAADTLFTVGPFTATGTGLASALQAALRTLAFALSVAVFSVTTPTEELLGDLERRGLGRRALFILGSALGMVPRLAARAKEIAEAQRARGLDTEGSSWRRLRGLLPLAGPLVSSALYEAEERALALEARAFSAPTRRILLRVPPDSPRERAARWALFLGSLLLCAASLAGRVRWP